MIDQIKKILLGEISFDGKQYQDIDREARLLAMKIDSECAFSPDEKLGYTCDKEFKEKYSKFLGKLFKTKSYREFLLRKEFHSKLVEDFNRLEEFLVQHRENFERISRAKSLLSLGLSISDVLKLCEERNIPLKVTLENLKEFEEGTIIEGKYPELESLKDLVLVHKTNLFPTNGIIKNGNGKILYKEIEIGGKEYQISFPQTINSVHFCINEEVPSHSYGSWDDCRYIIITPFSEAPLNRIGSGALTVDTWFNGDYKLSNNSIILVPENEYEKFKENSGGAKLIAYEGEKAMNYGNALIEMMGYVHCSGGAWGKVNDEKEKKIKKIMSDNISNVKFYGHSYSEQNDNEEYELDWKIVCATVNLIKNKGILDEALSSECGAQFSSVLRPHNNALIVAVTALINNGVYFPVSELLSTIGIDKEKREGVAQKFYEQIITINSKVTSETILKKLMDEMKLDLDRYINSAIISEEETVLEEVPEAR
jgi:hypothetical protein